jgi:hypothetical protein
MITATINGRDEISLKVLKALEKGERVKNIPSLYPVTIDQAKILSRYRRMLIQAKGKVKEENYKVLNLLGVKIIKLSPLFKQKDWEGINDILSVSTSETKRSELGLLMEVLMDNRKKVYEAQQKNNDLREQLEIREAKLISDLNDIKNKEISIVNFSNSIKYFHRETKQFLYDHIGIYNNSFILAKKIDEQWLIELVKNQSFNHDSKERVYYVNNIEQVAEQFTFRMRTGKSIYWKPSFEEFNNGLRPSASNNPILQTINGKVETIQVFRMKLKDRISDLKRELKEIELKLKNLKNVKPISLADEISNNPLSALKNINEIKMLQTESMKWLYENEYVVLENFKLPNNHYVDVIGLNRKGKVVIIKVISNMEDITNEQEIKNVLEYCDEYYLMVDGRVLKSLQMNSKELPEQILTHNGIGLLKWENGYVREVERSFNHMKTKHPTEILFEIAREQNKMRLF